MGVFVVVILRVSDLKRGKEKNREREREFVDATQREREPDTYTTYRFPV